MDVEVTSRSGPARCAVCHDELASSPAPCDGCGTVLHTECKDAVHGCPTMGCRNRVVSVVVTESQGDRDRARARRLGVVALVNGVAALYLAGLCHVLLGRVPAHATLTAGPLLLAFGGSVLLGAITLLLAVRSWRRSWVGTAALALEVAWLVLTGPQVFQLLAWSRPLSAAEVQAFTALIKGNEPALSDRIDVDAMLAVHDPDRDRLSDQEREEHQRYFHWQHFETGQEFAAAGGSHRILPPSADAGARVFVAGINGQLGVSYTELLLARGKDGQASCVDALEVRTNDAWAARQGRLRRLSRGKQDMYWRIAELANDGQGEAALAAYEELPEATRLARDFLAVRLHAAQQLDTERHVAALEALIAACPGEPEVLRWELAVARGDERMAIAALDGIDRRVGGDPFLDGLRAEAHSELGEHARAMELANQVVEALPDMRVVWWILLDCAVEARDHPRTRDALERLVVTFNHQASEVEGALDLTDFFASEEGEEWRLRSR